MSDLISVAFDFRRLERLQDKYEKLSAFQKSRVMTRALAAGAHYLEGPLRVAARVDTGFMRNAVYVITPEVSGYSAARAAANQFTKGRGGRKVSHGEDVAQELDRPNWGEVKIGFGAKYTRSVEMRWPWIRPTVRRHAQKTVDVIADHARRGIQDIFRQGTGERQVTGGHERPKGARA